MKIKLLSFYFQLQGNDVFCVEHPLHDVTFTLKMNHSVVA